MAGGGVGQAHAAVGRSRLRLHGERGGGGGRGGGGRWTQRLLELRRGFDGGGGVGLRVSDDRFALRRLLPDLGPPILEPNLKNEKSFFITYFYFVMADPCLALP